MSFITVEELNTHIYAELVAEITRQDDPEQDQIAAMAISAGVAEIKGYLTAYDIDTIFSQTGDGRDPLILTFAKDVAAWHLVCLANPNIDLELREKRYKNAIAWLKGVQAGDIVPDLPTVPWPVDDEGNPIPQEGRFRWGSNPQRTTHY